MEKAILILLPVLRPLRESLLLWHCRLGPGCSSSSSNLHCDSTIHQPWHWMPCLIDKKFSSRLSTGVCRKTHGLSGSSGTRSFTCYGQLNSAILEVMWTMLRNKKNKMLLVWMTWTPFNWLYDAAEDAKVNYNESRVPLTTQMFQELQ